MNKPFYKSVQINAPVRTEHGLRFVQSGNALLLFAKSAEDMVGKVRIAIDANQT
jgi:hypothetical protein